MSTTGRTPFGALLRQRRLAVALSQAALAERAGLSVDAIAALERGRRTAPRPHTLALLAAALGLPAEDRAAFIAAAAASPPPPRAPSLVTPALVGREREQTVLREALAAALAGRGGLALISGEAGIGKTALAEALCAEAERLGAHVLVGRAYDLSETPPYGPWTEARAQFPPSPDLPPLPSALHTTAHSPQQFFAEVRAFFAAAAAARPLVLLLDDLQWADPASLDLLRTVARALMTLPMLVLATYRPDDLTRRHPLAPLLPLLAREARAARLDLAPLSAAALGALVRDRYALAPADEDRLVAYLARRTDGNPLFATEVLRALEEQGVVDARGGGLGDLGTIAVPALLRQIVVGRVARLGVEAKRLLDIAAVIGQEVPLGVWAVAAETDEGTVEAVAERALEARLLVEVRGADRVAFAHGLIREALYEDLPAIRRRRLQRRVGETLAALREPLADAVAYHFQQAGDARATDWLARAGWRAYRAFAYHTARARFAAALPALTGGERARVLLALADFDRYREAGIGYAADAADAALAAGDEVLAAMARFRLGINRSYRGRVGEALAALAAADAVLDSLPDAALPDFRGIIGLTFSRQARGMYQALALAFAGQWRAALALAGGDPGGARGPVGKPTANGILALAYVGGLLGRPDLVRRHIDTSLALFAACEDDAGLYTMRVFEGHGLLLPFLLDDRAARQRYDEALAGAAGRVAEALGAAAPHLNRCPLLVVSGRWQEARALWAQRDGATIGHDVAASFPAIGLMALAQGVRDEAWALVGELLPDGPTSAPGATHFVAALGLQRLAAQLALDDGEREAARGWLEAHDRWLAWAGEEVRWGRADGRLAWADYHRVLGDPAAALRHAKQALADATEPRQPLALLAAQRLLGALRTDAGRYAEARGHLDVALALAEACAAPYERALTLLALAELCEAEGNAADTHPLLAEVRAICEPLGAQPALAQADALAARLTRPSPPTPARLAGLSAREVEVLRLVAQGWTDRRVAEHLFLSTRTVNQHLRSIYTKLGVSTRAAATRFAVEHGLALTCLPKTKLKRRWDLPGEP